MPHSGLSTRDGGDEACVVCQVALIAEAKKNTKCILPACGHAVMCQDCTDKWVRKNPSCPMCRKPVQLTFKEGMTASEHDWMTSFRIRNPTTTIQEERRSQHFREWLPAIIQSTPIVVDRRLPPLFGTRLTDQPHPGPDMLRIRMDQGFSDSFRDMLDRMDQEILNIIRGEG